MKRRFSPPGSFGYHKEERRTFPEPAVGKGEKMFDTVLE